MVSRDIRGSGNYNKPYYYFQVNADIAADYFDFNTGYGCVQNGTAMYIEKVVNGNITTWVSAIDGQTSKYGLAIDGNGNMEGIVNAATNTEITLTITTTNGSGGIITTTAKMRIMNVTKTVTFAVSPSGGGSVKDYGGTVYTTFSAKYGSYYSYKSDALGANNITIGMYNGNYDLTVVPSAATGYSFTGWSPSSGGPITSDTTITASFQASNVTISFDTNPSGMASWSSVTVASGTSVSASGNVLTVGSNTITAPQTIGMYVFREWSQTSGTVTSSKTLYARYYSPVTVYFSRTNCSTTYTQLEVPYNSSWTRTDGQNQMSISGSGYSWTVYATADSGYTITSWNRTGSGTFTSAANTVSITATQIAVTSLSISPSSKTLGKNGTATFTAVVSPSGASNNCTWSISPSGIVTLDTSSGGTVTVTAGTTTGSVTLTATSTVTSSKTATATIAVQNNHVYTISYDANGGTGAPSGESYTTTSETSHNFTVSATVPTRTGYTFVGWNTSPNGGGTYYTAGTTVTATENSPDVVLFAIWSTSPDVPTYTETNLPKAAVRIYKSPSSYVDMTYKMTVQPTIYKAVNRAGQFSFTVTNNPNNSFLSDDFNGWSDSSTGAVDWGMYCIVESINANGTTTYLTDGYVTTMEVNEYSLTFQCADHLAILGSRGADIHRNYYDSRTANVIQDVIRQSYISTAPEYILTDITEIISAGGSVDTSTLKYRTGEDDPLYAEGSTRSPIISGQTVYVNSWTKTFSNPFSSMTFKLYAVATSHKVNVTVDGTPYLSSFTTGSSGDYYLTVDFGTLYEGGEHTITIAGIAPTSGFLTDTMQVYVETSTGTGELVYYDNYGGQHTSSTGNPYVTIKSYNDTNVNAVSTYTSGARTYLKITGIYGKTIQTDYDELTVPITGRVKFSYLSGTVSATEIMNNIASRSGYIPLIHAVQNIPELKLFRSGGGYSLDYLQKIADIDRALTFTAHGYSPTLDIGARRTSANIPTFNVEYGTGEQVDNNLVMYSFKPRKSMTNRPSRALIRTAISDKNTGSTPVIAMVYNDRLLTSRKGIRTDTVVANSSVLSVFDAVRSAYTAVNHDEEDWEGTLTLSGIIPDMIDVEGAFAGSGTVISVTDPRYSFNDKSFVITDVTYDFEQITTTVTLTNAPQVYSSAIAESIATAYSAADLVVGDSESTAYNTQYVYVQKSGIGLQTVGNTMSITTSNGTISLGNVTAYVMDGHTLIYGSKTIVSGDNPSTAKYDVHTVTVNNVSITIPEESRPDCYEDQIVIVNVDVTT